MTPFDKLYMTSDSEMVKIQMVKCIRRY